MSYVIPNKILKLTLKQNKTESEQKECNILCCAASESLKNKKTDFSFFGFWNGFFTGRLFN